MLIFLLREVAAVWVSFSQKMPELVHSLTFLIHFFAFMIPHMVNICELFRVLFQLDTVSVDGKKPQLTEGDKCKHRNLSGFLEVTVLWKPKPGLFKIPMTIHEVDHEMHNNFPTFIKKNFIARKWWLTHLIPALGNAETVRSLRSRPSLSTEWVPQQ